MLTKQEQKILDDAPEGATHYGIGVLDCYYKNIFPLSYSRMLMCNSAWESIQGFSDSLKTIPLADLRNKQDKTVWDAVIECYSQGRLLLGCGWYTNQSKAISFSGKQVCTVEEFNQCVKEMSLFAGVQAYIDYGVKLLDKPSKKPFLQTCEEYEHTKTLNFIRERLINVHGENSHYDYMHKLTNAIIFIENAEESLQEVAAKEKPRTKVEYVKVSETPREIYQMLLSGDELYVNKTDKIYFDGEQFMRDDSRITYIKSDNDIYRKVETEITWQDELVDFIENDFHPQNAPYLAIKGNEIVIDGSMQLCAFVQMCNLVSSMTNNQNCD